MHVILLLHFDFKPVSMKTSVTDLTVMWSVRVSVCSLQPCSVLLKLLHRMRCYLTRHVVSEAQANIVLDTYPSPHTASSDFNAQTLLKICTANFWHKNVCHTRRQTIETQVVVKPIHIVQCVLLTANRNTATSIITDPMQFFHSPKLLCLHSCQMTYCLFQ